MADDEIPPNATIYVNNLNERVKIPELVEALQELFSDFGTVIDIVAKKNIWAKGQAFIVFDNVESAKEAIEGAQGFDLFEQKMKLAFAKTRSDATVAREDGEEGLERHKKKRLAAKGKASPPPPSPSPPPAPPPAEAVSDGDINDEAEHTQKLRDTVEQAKKQAAKRAAPEALEGRPAKVLKNPTAAGVIPEEYNPPNKVLFIRDIPDDYGKDQLAIIFQRFAGFKEVRLVPGRSGIAFIEYESEEGAIMAKENTTGMALGGNNIRVTYQKK